jgi:hypothetical protein
MLAVAAAMFLFALVPLALLDVEAGEAAVMADPGEPL